MLGHLAGIRVDDPFGGELGAEMGDVENEVVEVGVVDVVMEEPGDELPAAAVDLGDVPPGLRRAELEALGDLGGAISFWGNETHRQSLIRREQEPAATADHDDVASPRGGQHDPRQVDHILVVGNAFRIEPRAEHPVGPIDRGLVNKLQKRAREVRLVGHLVLCP